MTTIAERKTVAIANVNEVYSSGDIIGQPVMVDVSSPKSSANCVLLQVLNVTSPNTNKLKVVILNAAPVTVIANNAPYQPNAADIAKIIDVVSIDSFAGSFTAGKVGVAKQLALSIATGTLGKFWVVLVAGEDQTLASANSASISLTYYID